jgi:hypothetical protein
LVRLFRSSPRSLRRSYALTFTNELLRKLRTATICGSKLPLRSRGTAISLAPSSPVAVLFENPLRLLPLPQARRIALLGTQMLGQLGVERACQKPLLELL